MSQTVVDRLQAEFSSLIAVLNEADEISLISTADDNFRKSLLLAAASYFEHRMTAAVLSFVSSATRNHELVTSLVRNKAVARQYHTWFDWNAKNANNFFGMFGNGFRDFMKEKVNDDDDLDLSIRAFLELGGERNRLVHQDFGSFPLEKTSEEIYALYCRAMNFIEAFPEALNEFSTVSNDEEFHSESDSEEPATGSVGGSLNMLKLIPRFK